MRNALLVGTLLVASSLHAAKAPGAYPKTFTWRGESAVRIARLFKMDTARVFTVTLREGVELYRRDERHREEWLSDSRRSRQLAPPVLATIRFAPGKDPRLTLDGMFFDGGTSIPEVHPRFFFTSEFIPAKGPVPDSWRALFRGREETRFAFAPVRDVKVEVIRTTDYDGPVQDAPGFIIRVTIADR